MIREPKGIGSEIRDKSGDLWTLSSDGWSWSGAAPFNRLYRNWTWEKLLAYEGVKEVIMEVVVPEEKTFTKEEILEAYKLNENSVDLLDALGIEIPIKKVRYVVEYMLKEDEEDLEDFEDKDMFFDIYFGKDNTQVISAEVIGD